MAAYPWLPVELLERIAGLVPHKPALASLSRASRTLHAVSTPFLYRHIPLASPRTTTRLFHLLLSRPSLAALVHSLELHLHSPDEHRSITHGKSLFVSAYIRLVYRALRALPNLRALTFDHGELTLWRCSCTENLARSVPPLLHTLSLPYALRRTSALLARLPALHTLHTAFSDSPMLDLPPSALPALRQARISRQHVLPLLPGRPIEALSVLGTVTPDELAYFLIPMTRSTGPLRALSIRVFRADPAFYLDVASNLPDLADLVVHSSWLNFLPLPSPRQAVSHLHRDTCSSAFQHFSHLRTLELHAPAIGRVLFSINALPLLALRRACPTFGSLVLVSEGGGGGGEVVAECYFVKGGKEEEVKWVREMLPVTPGEFLF